MKEASKYILYARKSTEDDNKQVQSIPDQVRLMNDFARTRKLNVVEIVKETQSAKQPFIRPEFTKLLGMLETGKADGIICWELNRLSRNPTESGILQQMLQDEKLLDIQTNNRSYKPEDNAIIFSVEAGMSNQYVRDLMKNVRRGMYSKASNGWLPVVPGIGYKNDPFTKTIVVDEDRWGMVRKLWDLMLTGNYSVHELARKADEDWKLRTSQRRKRGGKPISTSGLYSLFQNPFYYGKIVYGGQTSEGKHKRMVTFHEFEQVQKLIRKNNIARPTINSIPEPFIFRGQINCGECGCKITYAMKTRHYKNGTSQSFEYCYCTNRRKDYNCSQNRSVKPEELHTQITAELSKYNIIPEFYEFAMKYLDELNEAEIKEDAEISKSLEDAVESIKNDISGLQKMLYSGRCSEDYFDSELKELNDKLSSAELRIEERSKTGIELKAIAGKAFTFARYAKERFISDSVENKRYVLSTLSENLTILDGIINFNPVKYLEPIKEANILTKNLIKKVGTSFTSEISDNSELNSVWCTRQDLNLRPSAPQADALSS